MFEKVLIRAANKIKLINTMNAEWRDLYDEI